LKGLQQQQVREMEQQYWIQKRLEYHEFNSQRNAQHISNTTHKPNNGHKNAFNVLEFQ